MLKSMVIENEILGRMEFFPHVTARRLIFRYVDDHFRVTVPNGISKKEVLRVVEQKQNDLLRLIPQQPTKVSYSIGDVINGAFGQVMIVQGKTAKITALLAKDGVQIVLPSSLEVERPEVQKQIARLIKAAAKRWAMNYLPNRLKELAEMYSVSYARFILSTGAKQLGRCNRKGDIALSYYLAFLTLPMVDYIILHELAHRTHFDHSPLFYALLDQYCGGNERSMRKALKGIRYPV